MATNDDKARAQAHSIRCAKNILRWLLEADFFWLNVDEVTSDCVDFGADLRVFMECIRALQPELVAFCDTDQS